MVAALPPAKPEVLFEGASAAAGDADGARSVEAGDSAGLGVPVALMTASAQAA